MSDRLVAAVLEPTAAEPVLLACATVDGRSQAPRAIAPGLLECARMCGAGDLDHVAVLDDAFARIERSPEGEPVPECEGPFVVRRLGGRWRDFVIRADAEAVEEVVERFRLARLSLRAVDAAPCARLALAEYLDPVGIIDPEDAQGLRRDALAAVSVAQACEEAASAMRPLLAVPVGAALAWFGCAGDAAR